MSRALLRTVLAITPAIFCSASAATYVPLVDPPVLVATLPAETTVTVYLPDRSDGARVYLSRVVENGTAVRLGVLGDAGDGGDQTGGDRVYTLRLNLNEASPGQAAYQLAILSSKSGPSRSRDFPSAVVDFSIPVVGVPEISGPSDYNQAVEDIFSSALGAQSALAALASPPDAIAPDEYNSASETARERLLAAYVNLLAILNDEATSTGQEQAQLSVSGVAQSSPSTPPVCPFAYCRTVDSLYDTASLIPDRNAAKSAFEANGNDPRVRDIKEYAISTCLLAEDQMEDPFWEDIRETCARDYYLDNALAEARNTALIFGGDLATDVPTNLVGEGVASGYDWGALKSTVKAGVKSAFRKVIDFFSIPKAQAQGLLLAGVADGETIGVPAGSSDLIYAFGGDVPRARAAGVTVSAGETLDLSFAPGETLDFNPPTPPSAEAFVGDWVTGGDDPLTILTIRRLGDQLEVSAFIRSLLFAQVLEMDGILQLPDDLGPAFTSVSDAADDTISVSWDLPRSRGPTPSWKLRLQITSLPYPFSRRLFVEPYGNGGTGEIRLDLFVINLFPGAP